MIYTTAAVEVDPGICHNTVWCMLPVDHWDVRRVSTALRPWSGQSKAVAHLANRSRIIHYHGNTRQNSLQLFTPIIAANNFW